MDILVGYTGFVGSNLALEHNFTKVFNSKNISEAYGLNPDLCVYSGVRAEKFLANNDPAQDMENIKAAIENIRKINPRSIVLISTIDIFKEPINVDEDIVVDTSGLHAYGYNRYYLEQWCVKHIENCHIVRLPGLFGENLKKNFIFDIINNIPSMLNERTYMEFAHKESIIKNTYINQGNGFFKCSYKNKKEKLILTQAYKNIGFSSVNFTDSRAVFQFYNLKYLWEHIQIALNNNIKLLHLAVEPICVNQIYKAVNHMDFDNKIATNPPKYDFRTKHYELFSGKNGYIFGKQKVLNDITDYIQRKTDK